MLGDYIDAYIEAKENGDKKEMTRIEKDLAKLGMDRMTLKVVVADEIERRKISKYADFLLTKVEAMLSYDCTKRVQKGDGRSEELGGVEKTETESEGARSRGRTTQEKGPR